MSSIPGVPKMRGGISRDSQPPPLDDDSCAISNCTRESLDWTSIPVCFSHLVEVGTMFTEMQGIAFGPDPSRRAAYEAGHEEMARDREANGVVYYIRLNNHVKIGTSVDLKGRMSALYAPPESLLATERGSYQLEARRHREFAPERIDKGRELFNPSPRLLAHINNLRARAGHEPLDTAA